MTEEQLEFDLPKQAAEITIQDLDRMVDVLAVAREEKQKQKDILKEKQVLVDEAEYKLLEALDTLGKKSYK